MTWTLILCAEGPLSSMERENRMKQGLCLVCGEAGHRKANCPKSRFKFNQTHRETSALSKRKKQRFCFPGTLHFGSAIHADTFFIDCGADDVFMDAELADRLKYPPRENPSPH
ncbi:hypothetical protein BASA62_001947 [Batrachochytrium salamandrivorans]|nr:hypothetical protein BASA62_001947 [Batrachochytrium salamandrivorans]